MKIYPVKLCCAILLVSVLCSCNNNKSIEGSVQQRIEDSIRAFEHRRYSDTMVPVATKYVPGDKVELPFNESPEANFFPYLDLNYREYEYDGAFHFLCENAYKEAEKKNDRAAFTYWKHLYDSLISSDSLKHKEDLRIMRARDSCAAIYGSPYYLHVVTKDSAGATICDYMLDTATLEVKYWKLSDQQIYRAKNQ